MKHPVRLLILAVCAMVGLTTAGLVPAVADTATRTITGTVWDEWEDEPIANVTVEVFTAQPTEGSEPVAATTTGTNGKYSITAPASPVWLRASRADYVTAVEAETRTVNVRHDFYLGRPSGVVTGSVTVRGGGTPDCAYVVFHDANVTDEDEAVGGAFSVDDDGTFEGDVPVGSWKFQAWDDCNEDLPGVWFGSGSTFETAQVFTVEADGETAIGNATLDPGVAITGKVTKTGTTTGLQKVEVYLESADGTVQRVATTSAGGWYTLPHVPDGTYDLWASDTLGEYADSAKRAITVAGSNLSGQNISLDPAPAGTARTIKGKVTGPGGAPAVGITVYAFGLESEDEEQVDTARTRRDGTYELNVAPDTYLIQFESGFDEEEGVEEYVSEWFDNSRTPYRAKQVRITAANAAKPFVANAQLVKTAEIQGKIWFPSDSSGSRGGIVRAYDADDDVAGLGFVAEDGSYSVRGLVPGRYRIRVDAYSGDEDEDEIEEGWFFGQQYIREYWNDRFSLGSAHVLTVGDGTVLKRINVAVSDTLSPTSAPKITGWAKKGKALKATAGTWSLNVGTAHAFQWYRGSVAIKGATKSWYVPTAADAGSKLRVRVVGSNVDDLYYPGVAWSAWTATVQK